MTSRMTRYLKRKLKDEDLKDEETKYGEMIGFYKYKIGAELRKLQGVRFIHV